MTMEISRAAPRGLAYQHRHQINIGMKTTSTSTWASVSAVRAMVDRSFAGRRRDVIDPMPKTRLPNQS